MQLSTTLNIATINKKAPANLVIATPENGLNTSKKPKIKISILTTSVPIHFVFTFFNIKACLNLESPITIKEKPIPIATALMTEPGYNKTIRPRILYKIPLIMFDVNNFCCKYW